jgi:nondiscriminating glutamyl-tRNA synthetase
MRLRFAPSPTGYLHVGNARTALFNWLLARGSGGTFILRIEDTDRERSTRESERSILDDLRWMGLDWAEGIDIGGDVGPYRQSERLHIYRAHAVELLAGGHAYQCFCSAAQLEADRQAALAAGRPPQYVGRCRGLSREEARRRISTGESAVVRLRVPEGRELMFGDLVRGAVSFSTEVIGDPVLLRSDGVPAYNFAVVVDDALMGITHVVRGEDHISNTPRQLLIYEAFGWRPPAFAHVSLVMGPDHAPLSKRHGATSVREFREKGYLPEALVNYLALIGWSPGEGDEVLPVAELAQRFRIEDVGRSAGVFDEEKLAWVNRHYLKAAGADRLARLAGPFLIGAGWLTEATDIDRTFLAGVLTHVSGAIDRLDQVPARVSFLFDYDPARLLSAPDVRAEVDAARPVLDAWAEESLRAGQMLDRETFRAAVARVRERTGQTGRGLLHPIRLAVMGETEGMELDLAVPTIERGAALPDSGLRSIRGVAARAAAFRAVLAATTS